MKSEWVNGWGNKKAELMVIGEAPAIEEVKRGIPFVGKTGQEVNSYLSKIIHVSRESTYTTNMFKYPLNDKKEYKEEEWEMMGTIMKEEIAEVNPNVILALGAISTKFFVPDYPDMEAVNGMPHYWINSNNNKKYVAVPSFHPAAAFHNSSIMQWVIEAFEAAGKCLNGEITVKTIKPLYCGILQMNKIISDCPKPKSLVAIDTETYKDGSPYMVQVAIDTRQSSFAYVNTISGHIDLALLSTYVSHPNVTTLIHNALFDLPILWSLGIHPHHYLDTMQIAFLLQTLPMGLKPLAYRLLGVKMKDYGEMVGELPDLSYIEESKRIAYACGDPVATLGVYHAMLPMWYPEFNEVLERDMEVMPMISAMMKRGIKANNNYFIEMQGELEVRNMELVERMIEEYPVVQSVARTKTTKKAGTVRIEDFNPGSDKQVAELLYKIMRVGMGSRIKKSRWGGSVDRNHMKKIQSKHPIVTMIQDYRETKTLADDFLNTLPNHIGSDGRIHTKISMIRIKHSGRLASSSPNLMAQPVRTEDGRRIRNGFEASPGFTFVSMDYNQVEMRVMAHLSRDEIMGKAYREGKDIHTETAMRIFGINKPENVDENKHRYPAKRVGFGVINDITAQGLARELVDGGAGVWTEDRCQELLDSWFMVYRGVRDYMMRVKAEVRRNRCVVDMWGRMEYIPQIMSAFPYIREEGLRIAINQGVQSGAQGIIKESMRKMWVKVGEWVRKDVAYPLIQIHDSIELEVRKGMVKEVTSMIKFDMENSVKISVPIVVEIKMGDRWGELKKW